MFLIEMPVNAEGKGPEMDPEKVVFTLWEVWNDECETEAVFLGKRFAENYITKMKGKRK